MATGFQRPPSAVISSWQHPLRGPFNLLDWLFRVPMQGKLNAVGSVTLTANAATTTYSDPRIGGESWIGFMPTTANAAAEIGAGTLYVTARADGSCILNHANNAQADRSFDMLIIG